MCVNINRLIINIPSDFKNNLVLKLKLTIIFSCVLISKFRHETNFSLSHDVTTFSHMKFNFLINFTNNVPGEIIELLLNFWKF